MSSTPVNHSIKRINNDQLTKEQFKQQYLEKNQPIIITNIQTQQIQQPIQIQTLQRNIGEYKCSNVMRTEDGRFKYWNENKTENTNNKDKIQEQTQQQQQENSTTQTRHAMTFK